MPTVVSFYWDDEPMSSRSLFGIAFVLALAGCADEPQGQVVATVDGEEVTAREVMAELNAMGTTGKGAKAQAAALDMVIERKLLVRAAQSALLDQLPAFQIEALRQRELALASLLLRRNADRVSRPSGAAIAAHIAANPWRYDRRVALQLERVDGAAQGSVSVADSASLSETTAERLGASPLNAPVAVVEGGQPMTVIVRNRWPLTADRAVQAREAAADLHATAISAAQRTLLAQLKAEAKIRRQPGS